MNPLTLLLIAAFVAAGVALGWIVGRGRAGAIAEERGKAAEALRTSLSEVTRERDAAMRELAGLQADARNFEARMKELMEAKEALTAQFHEVGAKLLSEAQKQFLERADARFNQASEKSDAQLKALLQPVEATLKRYEEGLSKVEKERVGSYQALREAVTLLHAGHSQVRDETARLVNALRSSPKARGRWGEQSLKNVLEQAGLSPFADFQTEVSVSTDDGRLRPDVIVRLPGGRKLIIDAKCSLNAYLDACDEVDDEKREACFRAHVASMRNHAQQLGSKAYWAQFGDAADYVIMYIPGEHFLAAALEQDPTLWDWAFERRVLLATPTNLVAIAKTVASIWRQERLAEAAQEIANLGKELHSRLATMNEHMSRVGKNLATANSAYNQMVGSFESQVLTQAKRFETLGAGSAKTLDSPPMVEIAPRPLTKIAATPSNDDPLIAAEEPLEPAAAVEALAVDRD